MSDYRDEYITRRLHRLRYMRDHGVATWKDRLEIAELEREQVERQYDRERAKVKQ